MNTFQLKIAGFAIVVAGLIVLVKVFLPSETEPEPKPKTFYDVVEEDDRRLRAEPRFRDQAAQSQDQTRPVEPEKPQFKELDQIEKIQAEKLFNLALQERKMGRLPGVKLGFKKMVDHCREIIQRWPDSEYAFKAKRMLADIPPRYRKRYNITDEEIDLGDLK